MAILLDGGDFPTAFPARDKLLCELMYGAALRVSEAAHIMLDDLRPEQKTILIHGKGGLYGKNAKQRLVPLNPHSQKALDAYQRVRSSQKCARWKPELFSSGCETMRMGRLFR